MWEVKRQYVVIYGLSYGGGGRAAWEGCVLVVPGLCHHRGSGRTTAHGANPNCRLSSLPSPPRRFRPPALPVCPYWPLSRPTGTSVCCVLK